MPPASSELEGPGPPPPAAAAWTHQGARTGFEVVFFRAHAGGHRVEGCTTAVEDGLAWVIDYVLELDATWTTRSAAITGRAATGACRTVLEADGAGSWLVDGLQAPRLDGCLDVDLESSAMTNALPVRRMGLRVGDQRDAPAAYVRAPGLTVERLEQRYARVGDDGSRRRYDYAAPAFGFAARLTYDGSGLVVDYPGLAVRTA